VERHRRLILKMRRTFHRRTVAALALCTLAPAFSAEQKKPAPAAIAAPAVAVAPEISEHMREELGINEFTTPSIAVLLQALQALRPVPYELVERPLPTQNPGDRARLALSTGAVIADGFLAIVAEKQSRIEPVARALIRHAKGLGVGEHVTRHSRSVLEKVLVKDWKGIHAELIGTQRDVENGMMALRDEEIAHLVALGGWWRGLEISSGILSAHYTPQGATLIAQPGIIDYFADRVSTMHPTFQKTKLWIALNSNLAAVRKLAVKPERAAPSLEDVQAIRVLAKAMNDVIAAPEE
jgi:hypothetical protein